MKKKEALIHSWLEEEKIAHIKGWDFSHINNRYVEEEDLPWNYKEIILKYLKAKHHLLDIDTGGGEFLLSLKHPYLKTSATEAYPPNVELCKQELLPLGINFKEADALERLPFENNTFDIVINRHGSFNSDEIYRVLKPGGIFITQQVGAQNDRELVEMLYENVPELPFPKQYLNITKEIFEKSGFTILEGQEVFKSIKFYDIGALVWFAHIIEWEFPNFSVEKHLNQLLALQEKLVKEGKIEGRTHRFFMVARK